jgi:hypothetical protein
MEVSVARLLFALTLVFCAINFPALSQAQDAKTGHYLFA